MAVLLSWMAYNNDFTFDEVVGDFVVNQLGPHSDLYQDTFKFQTHYLLTISREETPSPRLIKLVQFLRQKFSKDVEVVYIDIDKDDIINLPLIKTKVHEFIIGLNENEVEIFISPGTATMQTVWYMIGWEFGDKVKLFQRRRPDQRKEGTLNNEYITVSETKLSGTLALIENSKVKKGKSNQASLITPTLRKRTYNLADDVANTNNVTTLITGERGTGKEGLARYIHDRSSRRSKPYIEINCGGIPDNLLETLLFGHIKEIASDIGDHIGAFEKAHRGTIFLDEIGDVSPRLQSTLLRAIQKKEIIRVGEVEPRAIDVRFISATNKNISKLINEGIFREDFYDRINTVQLRLPSFIELPKSERLEFLNYMIDLKANSGQFNKPKLTLSTEVIEKLLTHSFAGNIRELSSVIDHLYTFCNGVVTIEDLPSQFSKNGSTTSLDWQENINNHLIKVLKMLDGNISAASRIMDVSPTTIRTRISKFNLPV